MGIFEIIPDTFQGLDNITEIDFNHNKLPSISPIFFKEVPNLKSLSIADNEIASIEYGVVANASHLQSLNLSHNKIEELDVSVFAGATSLRVLDLSNNQIKALTSHNTSNAPIRGRRQDDQEYGYVYEDYDINLENNRIRELELDKLRDMIVGKQTVENWVMELWPGKKERTATNTFSTLNLDVSLNWMSGHLLLVILKQFKRNKCLYIFGAHIINLIIINQNTFTPLSNLRRLTLPKQYENTDPAYLGLSASTVTDYA